MDNNSGDTTCPLGLLSTLNEMRVKNDFCDATIKTDDGGYFNVHKIILVANSSYFRALYNNLNSGNRREVLIPGVSSDMMEQIIEYAYLRQSSVDWNNVWDLLVASDQFNVSGLVAICSDFLVEHMAPLNCIRVWKFARNFFIRELESEAYRYLMANIRLVPSDCRDFENLDIEEICEMFSDSRLNLSEEDVWWMLLSWMDANEENSYAIRKLLSCVRTSFVSKDFLFREIISNDLVAFDEECRFQILEKYRILTQLPLITDMDMVCPVLATPRIPHEILFLIGGCIDNMMVSNNILAYDSKADMWTQVQHEMDFERRAYHKCLAIGHEIYIIGGRDESECVTTCYRFNVVNKAGTETASLLHPRSSLCAAVLSGEIYAIGGCDGDAVFSSTEVYNPTKNKWRFSEKLQTPRVRAAAAVLDNSIFVAGGYTGNKYLKSVEVYDPDSDMWLLSAPMRHKRSELSLASCNGFLYAVGGFCGNKVLSTVEMYDPSTNNWVLLAEMKTPRCGFSMAVINEDLVIIGGLIDDGVESCTVERYDHLANKWDPLGDNEHYCLAAAECIVKDLDDVSEYVFMDRSHILINRREQMVAFKERNDGSFTRALSMYNM